jgi:hypothetical protein
VLFHVGKHEIHLIIKVFKLNKIDIEKSFGDLVMQFLLEQFFWIKYEIMNQNIFPFM